MPISLGFWEWGRPKRAECPYTVTPERAGKIPHRDLGRSDKRFRHRLDTGKPNKDTGNEVATRFFHFVLSCTYNKY